jgi:hypothetical protein
MEIAVLTALAMTALNTFFGKAVEGAGTKAGEAAFEQGKRIFEAIKARFHKEHDEGAALALTTMPKDKMFALVVEQKLADLLKADPAFAQQLEQIIQTGPRQSLTAAEEAEVQRIRMRISGGAGDQSIRADKRAKVSDVDMDIQ